MNILAHCLLSGNNSELLIGNFVGDFVKGKQILDYPTEVQNGIMLHRNIDDFTDRHPVTRNSKKLFSASYGKFAGVIIDILYDHFIYKDWECYSTLSYDEFTKRTNSILIENHSLLPKAMHKYADKFIKNTWFNYYRTLEGIGEVLNGMARNTRMPDESQAAMLVIKNNFTTLQNDFRIFFPTLVKYVIKEYDIKLQLPKVDPQQ